MRMDSRRIEYSLKRGSAYAVQRIFGGGYTALHRKIAPHHLPPARKAPLRHRPEGRRRFPAAASAPAVIAKAGLETTVKNKGMIMKTVMGELKGKASQSRFKSGRSRSASPRYTCCTAAA